MRAYETERLFADIHRILSKNDWVKVSYLVEMTGINATTIRSTLRDMRMTGLPIIGGYSRGVKLAKTDEEVREYIATLEDDVETRLNTIAALKRAYTQN